MSNMNITYSDLKIIAENLLGFRVDFGPSLIDTGSTSIGTLKVSTSLEAQAKGPSHVKFQSTCECFHENQKVASLAELVRGLVDKLTDDAYKLLEFPTEEEEGGDPI